MIGKVLCSFHKTYSEQQALKISTNPSKIEITPWKMRAYDFYSLELSSIRKRTSERSERVSFLILLCIYVKYRTKHFPWCNLFIL